MKKTLSFFIIICICFSLAGCAKVYKGTDALIEKAREEIPIADAENTDITYAGMCGKDDSALCWFISGNEYQLHTYLPIEFEIKGVDKYTFVHTFKPMGKGEDIAVLNWKGGYAFLINDPKCVAVKITGNNSTTEEKIEKDAYPYVFYCPFIPSEYVFLDVDGNEIQ